MFPAKFAKKCQNTFFEKHLQTAASEWEELIFTEIKWKFLHFLSADFLLGFFFRLYIIFEETYMFTQEILPKLLMYEAVFKCNNISISL